MDSVIALSLCFLCVFAFAWFVLQVNLKVLGNRTARIISYTMVWVGFGVMVVTLLFLISSVGEVLNG